MFDGTSVRPSLTAHPFWAAAGAGADFFVGAAAGGRGSAAAFSSWAVLTGARDGTAACSVAVLALLAWLG